MFIRSTLMARHVKTWRRPLSHIGNSSKQHARKQISSSNGSSEALNATGRSTNCGTVSRRFFNEDFPKKADYCHHADIWILANRAVYTGRRESGGYLYQ